MREIVEYMAGTFAAGGAIVGATMIDVSDPVIVTIGGAILATLTGSVKVLWDRNTALTETTQEALSKCEQEHRLAAKRMDSLVTQVIGLSAEVGTLKGRIQGFQEATEKSDAARERASHTR